MNLGDRFGKLIVVSATYLTKLSNGKGRSAVMCECVCGTRKQVLVINLVRGLSTSCGRCKQNSLPKQDDVIGSWTIMEVLGRKARCRCVCGNIREVDRYSLVRGDSFSCHGRTNDGRRRAKLKRIWLLMLDRCENPTSIGWKDYGGRGIQVCSEWHDFETFYNWAVKQGYLMLTGLQIDRIECNGAYEPGNCRWVDKFVNARNKRNTRWITAFGETKSLPDWLEDARCTVSYATLWARINRGRNAEEAITYPARRNH